MLDSFISYLQYERRASKHTILSYKNDLSQFSEFLQFQPLDTVSFQDIRSWVIFLVENNNAPISINRKIASLRAFYKFLLQRQIIERDPTIKVRALKSKKAIPHFVEEEKIIDLLDEEMAEEASEFLYFRNALIMELFYGTGIRLSELVGINNKDISLYDSILKVVGKRNKERIIPIHITLKKLINSYLEIKSKEYPAISHNFLLITTKGAPIYPKLVYRVVKKRLDMVQNLDKRSPHVLRHTFATHLLNQGADLNSIKELLGHTSLAATQIYTHNSLEKIKAIFNQAHPKA